MKMRLVEILSYDVGDRIHSPDGAGTVTAVEDYTHPIHGFVEQTVTVQLDDRNEGSTIEVEGFVLLPLSAVE